MSSINRIYAMLLRYLYLHKRSVSRTLEIIFWPVMDLMVWGFLSVYIRSLSQGPLADTIVYLLGAMIFWDILYRSQQGVSISFVEDIWAQNISNLFVSPLRIWEWIAATFLYSILKIAVITLVLAGIAYAFYGFDFFSATGWAFFPLVANLFIFGWAVGVFTSGLLIRWGHSVEALIWGIPFLLQPFSAIFYPLSILPLWVQKIALWFPSTYVFEGMRAVMAGGPVPEGHLLRALGLNILYFALATKGFHTLYLKARNQGRLGRLGMD